MTAISTNQKPAGTDTTIRAKRLMKEFKEIQRSQSKKTDPDFEVGLFI